MCGPHLTHHLPSKLQRRLGVTIFEANAKYWYFLHFLRIQNLSGCLGAIFATPELAECRLGPEGDGALVEMGHSDYSERLSSSTLQFTKRVHLYLDFDISPGKSKLARVRGARQKDTIYRFAIGSTRANGRPSEKTISFYLT